MHRCGQHRHTKLKEALILAEATPLTLRCPKIFCQANTNSAADAKPVPQVLGAALGLIGMAFSEYQRERPESTRIGAQRFRVWERKMVQPAGLLL